MVEVVADTAAEAVMNTEEVVAEMEEAVVITRDIAEVVVEKDTVVVAVREVAKEEVTLEATEETEWGLVIKDSLVLCHR